MYLAGMGAKALAKKLFGFGGSGKCCDVRECRAPADGGVTSGCCGATLCPSCASQVCSRLSDGRTIMWCPCGAPPMEVK